MNQFDSLLSDVIDSTLGLRSRTYGYQYSEIIRSLMCVFFCGGSCIEDMNKGFGWKHLPKSFMAENAVYLLMTALIRNFYKTIIRKLNVKDFGLSGILSLHSVSYYIAGCVNYSASHFGQIFLKKTGHSPLNYFNQLKIQKACQMLDFSDMKIKEIANELGFYDQYHFSKTFFKITGETPSQYKKRNKG